MSFNKNIRSELDGEVTHETALLLKSAVLYSLGN